jgi:glycosyltransferase involved in cell wall biosynthesis
LLLPAGDVAALAAALADLASDPPRRERLAQAARTDVAARFQLRKIVEQWQELLESVSSEQHHV